MTNKILSGFVK